MTSPRTTVFAPLGQSVLVAALIVAAGAIGWVLYDLGVHTPVTTRTPPDAPEAYMENFVTVEMDGTGKPSRRIEASYMSYHADQTVELAQPRYTLFRPDGEPWHIRSERGHVSADGTVVWLLGNVDVWRNDGDGARDLDIWSEHLKVLPDTEYAETEEPVTIRTPGSMSTGVGMRAYLGESRFQLISQVRTDVHRRPQR